MKKKLFVRCIEKIKADREKERKICDVLEEVSGDSGSCNVFLFDETENFIYEILADYYSEEIVEGYIAYFTCELEFGEKWKPGDITDGDKDIKLQTIDDLYDACEKALNESEGE